MSGIKVVKASPFCSITDMGRIGYLNIGISTMGAMDEYAFHFANKLLENKFNTPSIQILFGGLILESKINSSIVLTGAKFDFTINEKPCKNWTSYEIKIGDKIEFKKKLSGNYAYLAIKDGFEYDYELNSVVESIKSQDFLKAKNSDFRSGTKLRDSFIPDYEKSITLRVIESYQHKNFTEKQKKKFYSSFYEVTSEHSAMGYKLEGNSIKCKKSDIISEGIAYGSIQIPASGKPIVLLKNRQTIGGYPKFGCVMAIDCFKLSQLKEGSKVNFEPISLKKAQKKLRDFYLYFR